MATVNFAWMTSTTTSNNVAVIALANRLAWAEAQGDRPLWPNGPTASAYVGGFVRRPGMGSYVTEGGHEFKELRQVAGLFEALDWAEVQPADPKPGNKYYQAVLKEHSVYSAFQEVALLGDLPEEKLESVRVRKGPHGLELVCPGEDGLKTKTKIVNVIVDDNGLVTWFPGEVTPPLNVAKATVKLI